MEKSQVSETAPGVVPYEAVYKNCLHDLHFLFATLQVFKFDLDATAYEGVLKLKPDTPSPVLKASYQTSVAFVKALLSTPGLVDVVAHHLHNHYLTMLDKREAMKGKSPLGPGGSAEHVMNSLKDTHEPDQNGLY